MSPHSAEPDASAPTESPGSDEIPEPVTTGTLFIMLLFLMALAAMWGLMYLTLIGR